MVAKVKRGQPAHAKALRNGPIQEETLRDFGKRNMLHYAEETILERALPDMFDGLKPVQRRILWAASQMPKEFLKTARLVGDTMGKYHPHGDMSISEAITTMVHLPVSPLLGRGNWGAPLMGSSAAAPRYTNVRLSRFGYSFFNPDYINPQTTSFVPNYDDKDIEPVTLPAQLPYVLMTGNFGIAVGITANFPAFTPESLIEVLTRLLKGEKLTVNDFASTLQFNNRWGGQLVESPENEQAWDKMFRESETLVKFEAPITTNVADRKIVIDSWPRDTNIPKFLEKVRALKDTKRADLTKGATTVTVLMKTGYNPAQFAAYAKKVQALTRVSLSFKINVTRRTANQQDGIVTYTNAIKSYSVPALLVEWIRERLAFEMRSLAYRRGKQQAAIEYSELLLWAVDNIDAIIHIIRTSLNPEADLQKKLELSAEQAKQILDLQLRRLSKLDETAIQKKLAEQQKFLKQLQQWTKHPQAKVANDLSEVLQEIIKDRSFKTAVVQQELKVV